jgi:hypothetical protein
MDAINSQFSLVTSDPSRVGGTPEKSSKFKDFMKSVGKAAAGAGKAILPMVPGGAVIGAALSGFSNQSEMQGLNNGLNPYDMLQLQQQMLQEARTFTLMSNIMKTRHDSIMNAIRNIR